MPPASVARASTVRVPAWSTKISTFSHLLVRSHQSSRSEHSELSGSIDTVSNHPR